LVLTATRIWPPYPVPRGQIRVVRGWRWWDAKVETPAILGIHLTAGQTARYTREKATVQAAGAPQREGKEVATNRRVYSKPIRVGWILTLIGVLGGITGIVLADRTKESGFFALLAFGVLLVITGLVTVGVYGAMERGVRRVFSDEAPLLKFSMSGADYAAFAKAEAEEIGSANKASLFIALFFCALVAVIGSFVMAHDGYLMFFIGAGLAFFLTGSAWVITKYRIHKLMRGDKEVVLTSKGAFVGSQFHTWSAPATFLSGASYFSPGEYEGCARALLRITYNALNGTLITPYTFVIVVPQRLEDQARAAAAVLQAQSARGAKPTGGQQGR
jgi:hypothetical protein